MKLAKLDVFEYKPLCHSCSLKFQRISSKEDVISLLSSGEALIGRRRFWIVQTKKTVHISHELGRICETCDWCGHKSNVTRPIPYTNVERTRKALHDFLDFHSENNLQPEIDELYLCTTCILFFQDIERVATYAETRQDIITIVKKMIKVLCPVSLSKFPCGYYDNQFENHMCKHQSSRNGVCETAKRIVEFIGKDLLDVFNKSKLMI